MVTPDHEVLSIREIIDGKENHNAPPSKKETLRVT